MLQLRMAGPLSEAPAPRSLPPLFIHARPQHPTGATVHHGPDAYCFTGKQLRALAHLMKRVGLIIWQQVGAPGRRLPAGAGHAGQRRRPARWGCAWSEGSAGGARARCRSLAAHRLAPLTRPSPAPPPVPSRPARPQALLFPQHITKLGTLRLDDPGNLRVEEVRRRRVGPAGGRGRCARVSTPPSVSDRCESARAPLQGARRRPGDRVR